MFGSPARGAIAYANVSIETGVAAATPHKLIVMLFDSHFDLGMTRCLECIEHFP